VHCFETVFKQQHGGLNNNKKIEQQNKKWIRMKKKKAKTKELSVE